MNYIHLTKCAQNETLFLCQTNYLIIQCYELPLGPKDMTKSLKVALKYHPRDIYGMIKEGGGFAYLYLWKA
jgi:hypothetical protein